MGDYCVSCHSGDDPAAGFALTSFDEVRRQAESGHLLERINDASNPMPKSGLMPKSMRKAIEDWAQNGYSEYTETGTALADGDAEYKFEPPEITPVDIHENGFEFFDLMPGHWVGELNIMGDQYDWFAFDYRPISASHVHGIFEGGTMGNLFTSFFIANYKGTPTIMARNGGLLNGIYRTSYFVLDKAELTSARKYFRLVDAYGGKEIMWMELEFKRDQLRFNSYTSRMGLSGKPSLHMKFSARRMHQQLSQEVAQTLNYPQQIVEKDFPDGLPLPHWGSEYPVITSASYIRTDSGNDLPELARLAGDPYRIDEIPHLASLTVNIGSNEAIEGEPVHVYLSMAPLTDGKGVFLAGDVFDGILSFPEIAAGHSEFTFTYLHPGKYFITLVADLNHDGYASAGDISSASREILVGPEEEVKITVDDINNQN